MNKEQIIAELESQHKAIGKALAALSGEVKAGRRKLSAATKAKMSRAMKAAWAKRKGHGKTN